MREVEDKRYLAILNPILQASQLHKGNPVLKVKCTLYIIFLKQQGEKKKGKKCYESLKV